MGDARHLSAETLDLLLLHSLPEVEASSARAHLDACPDCRSLVQEREADRAHFQQHVFPRTVGTVEARARSPFERFRTPWALAVPAVALALLALIVVQVPSGDDDLYIGVKGGPRLQIVALRGETQFPVSEGTRLRPGDRIRFRVDPGEAHHLLIASKDGAGHASIYFNGAVQAGLQDLPGSIELDAALGPEHLHALFSDTPLDAQSVLRALESGAPLPHASAELVRTFVKESP